MTAPSLNTDQYLKATFDEIQVGDRILVHINEQPTGVSVWLDNIVIHSKTETTLSTEPVGPNKHCSVFYKDNEVETYFLRPEPLPTTEFTHILLEQVYKDGEEYPIAYVQQVAQLINGKWQTVDYEGHQIFPPERILKWSNISITKAARPKGNQ